MYSAVDQHASYADRIAARTHFSYFPTLTSVVYSIPSSSPCRLLARHDAILGLKSCYDCVPAKRCVYCSRDCPPRLYNNSYSWLRFLNYQGGKESRVAFSLPSSPHVVTCSSVVLQTPDTSTHPYLYNVGMSQSSHNGDLLLVHCPTRLALETGPLKHQLPPVRYVLPIS